MKMRNHVGAAVAFALAAAVSAYVPTAMAHSSSGGGGQGATQGYGPGMMGSYGTNMMGSSGSGYGPGMGSHGSGYGPGMMSGYGYGSDDARQRCAAHFKSFEWDTGLYTTYKHGKRLCPYLQ